VTACTGAGLLSFDRGGRLDELCQPGSGGAEGDVRAADGGRGARDRGAQLAQDVGDRRLVLRDELGGLGDQLRGDAADGRRGTHLLDQLLDQVGDLVCDEPAGRRGRLTHLVGYRSYRR
jgi:hypothetical protein